MESAELVKMLLDAGADKELKDGYSEKPIDDARRKRLWNIVELLK